MMFGGADMEESSESSDEEIEDFGKNLGKFETYAQRRERLRVEAKEKEEKEKKEKIALKKKK